MIYIIEIDIHGHSVPQKPDTISKMYFIAHGFPSWQDEYIPNHKLVEMINHVLPEKIPDMYPTIRIHEEYSDSFDKIIDRMEHNQIHYQQVGMLVKISDNYIQLTHNVFPLSKMTKLVDTTVRLDIFESNEEFVSYTSHNNEFVKGNLDITNHVLFGKEPDGSMFFSLSNPVENLIDMIKERIEISKKEISFLIVYHNLKIYNIFSVEHALFANGIEKESIDILNGKNIAYIYIRDNGLIVEPIKESDNVII